MNEKDEKLLIMPQIEGIRRMLKEADKEIIYLQGFNAGILEKNDALKKLARSIISHINAQGAVPISKMRVVQYVEHCLEKALNE